MRLAKHLIVLFAGLAAGADKPDPAALKKEWASLEGTWTVIRLEIEGKSLLLKEEPPPQVVIKDGKIRGKDARKEALEDTLDSSKVQLDPGAKPKTITIPNFKGGDPKEGVTLIGIYELEGDQLKVCVEGVETAKLKEREKDRPKAFDSKQGLLLVFKRDKK